MGKPYPEKFLALLDRLAKYRVRYWGKDAADYTVPEAGPDRWISELDDAHVVSSLWANGQAQARHALVIDIDHDAWLVRSTTPGHFHLYIDVPDGIPHERYMALLHYLADCGVIEKGYANASVARGHSDVRLPWVKKGQEK